MYKIGVDVGGTNTDAVLINERLEVVAETKHPTTQDVYDGILQAVRQVLKDSRVNRAEITQAMLGTTQCTNAIVERKHLVRVGLVRLGAPATTGIPPMVDWPEELRSVVVESVILRGGFEFDGKELAPLDMEAAQAFFERMRGQVDAIAISGVFSTIRNDQELAAASLCQEVMGDEVHISVSSEIGSMGLIERENAAILNAALCQVAKGFTDGFVKSLKGKGITNAEIYLSQNDGTLITMDHARRYPILTIACGPTNSIRGASYLSRMKNAVVIDVGGTTTDFGMIQNGFPRESSAAAVIGGVRTNFRMPDIISIGLGGGSIILPKTLAGIGRVYAPGHFGCANAIGSVISKVSGSFEQLMDYDQIPREQALEQARAGAVRLAVEAGAVEDTVEIIEAEDVPLAYCVGNTCRVRVKAAGDLA